VKHATAEQKRELRRMAERTDVLFNRCTAGDTDAEFLYEVHSYHLEFHMRIAQAAGSQALMHALERNQVLIFNWLFDVAVQHQQRPPRSHRELAEVLCGNDVEAADRAMRKHIQYGLDEIVGGITARTGARWRAGAASEISEAQESVSL
jgi:DNA-binding FadR family transcriptional regulator